MKAIPWGLLDSVTGTYGDLTKTFKTPRINTKVVNSKTCLSAPFNSFAPVLDDSGGAPVEFFYTSNNRLFTLNAIAAGVGRLSLYDVDVTTGLHTYIGGLNISFVNTPATTHTTRAFKVDDGASSASVTGWRIFVATTGSVTANGGTYMAMSVAKTDFTAVPTTLPTATLADSKQVYKLENSPFTLTQAAGLIITTASTRIYMHNGVSATHQYAKFNYSTSTGVPGANGVTTALFEFITGNLPALSGTLLLTNSEFKAVPNAAPHPVSLIGFDCAFLTTGTTGYLGLLSELTNGATTWPSLIFTNYLTPTLLVNPTPIGACWSNDIDRLIANVSNSQFITKPVQNGNIEYFFGSVDSTYLEAGGYLTPFNTTLKFGGITASRVQAMNGWIYTILSTVGQRGVMGAPIQSDFRYLGDYIITKVLSTPITSALVALSRIRPLTGNGASFKIQYRISGFASQTAGWLDLPTQDDALDTVAPGTEFQLRLLPKIVSGTINHTDAMPEGYLITQPNNEVSSKWVFDGRNTTSTTPVRSAFSQVLPYGTAIPKLVYRAYVRNTGALFIQRDTVANPTEFEASVNDGTSFGAIGTATDTPFSTVVVYKHASPPGVELIHTLRES